MKAGYVYIMASSRNGTLYIGVTSDLLKRVWEYRNGVVPGFTKKYGCYDDLQEARRRELQNEEVEATVEARRDRADESRLAGSLPGAVLKLLPSRIVEGS